MSGGRQESEIVVEDLDDDQEHARGKEALQWI